MAVLAARSIAVAGVVASILASASLDFRKVPTVGIQPSSGAFAIWSVIFPLLVVSSVAYGATDVFPWNAVISLAVALFATVVWAAAVRYKLWWFAFASLLGTAVCSWVAATLAPFGVDDARSWVVQLGLSTFAGWTTVACALNLAIAEPFFDDPRTLVGAALVAAASCVATRRPLPCVAVLWALAFQREQGACTGAALLIAGLGGVGAAVRLLRVDA